MLDTPDGAWRLASASLRILTYASALFGTGGALFLLVFRHIPAALHRRIARAVAGWAVAGLAAAALALPVQAGYLAGGGLEGMLDGELLGMVASSPAGSGAAMALVGWALMLSVLVGKRVAAIGALTGGVLVVAALTVAGHAAATAPVLGRILVGVHLLAAAFWAGALWPLLQVARSAPRSDAAAVLVRFGLIAVWMVGGLVLAGVGLAALLLSSVEALWATSYGRILLTKLVLVAALLSLAALNRLRLVPQFSTERDDAPAQLERSIRAEVVLAVLIIVATAMLTTFATPFT